MYVSEVGFLETILLFVKTRRLLVENVTNIFLQKSYFIDRLSKSNSFLVLESNGFIKNKELCSSQNQSK
jgi:hypothetical protein